MATPLWIYQKPFPLGENDSLSDNQAKSNPSWLTTSSSNRKKSPSQYPHIGLFGIVNTSPGLEWRIAVVTNIAWIYLLRNVVFQKIEWWLPWPINFFIWTVTRAGWGWDWSGVFFGNCLRYILKHLKQTQVGWFAIWWMIFTFSARHYYSKKIKESGAHRSYYL